MNTTDDLRALSASVLFGLVVIGLAVGSGLLEPVLASGGWQWWAKLHVIRDQNRPLRMNNFDVRAYRARIHIHAVSESMVLSHNLATRGAVTHEPPLCACVLAALPLRVSFP